MTHSVNARPWDPFSATVLADAPEDTPEPDTEPETPAQPAEPAVSAPAPTTAPETKPKRAPRQRRRPGAADLEAAKAKLARGRRKPTT